jgi:hypothetical protein
MNSFVGIWKLVRVQAFDAEGKEVEPLLGPKPMGVFQMDSERIIGAIVDGRVELPPGSPQRFYVSYTGRYEFDGNTLITHVDGASRPEAYEVQVRQVRFEGPDRVVLLPPPSSSGVRQEVTWERVG